jgi:hypothetical protein
MVWSLAFGVKGKAISVQAQRDRGGWCSQISRQSAHAGRNLVSPTHRPPLPPSKYYWYSLLEAESAPGPQRGRKDYVNEKLKGHNRESNPRPSGLWRSASTNCATACPRHLPYLRQFKDVVLFTRSRGSRSTAPFILNVGTRRRWMVNFTSRPLYPRRITPVPISQEATLAPEPVLTVLERKKSLASTAIRTPDRPAISPVSIPTTLPVLAIFEISEINDFFFWVCLINREFRCAYHLLLDAAFLKNRTGRTDGRALWVSRRWSLRCCCW